MGSIPVASSSVRGEMDPLLPADNEEERWILYCLAMPKKREGSTVAWR
jgi:hypothetical protein